MVGLFGGGGNDHQESCDGYSTKGDIVGVAGTGHTERPGGNEAARTSDRAAKAAGGGGGRTVARGSPPQPRKGSKLGLAPRARTVPEGVADRGATGARESPEGG